MIDSDLKWHKYYYIIMKIILKISILIFAMINCLCINSYAKLSFYEAEKKNYNSFGEDFNLLYQTFIDSIGVNDLTDINAYWCRMRDNNDKLIIGGSGVVYCGYTMGDELDQYGYDIVGFGGMCDDKIKDWIPKIKKKYRKIIIFEGVNTVNLAMGAGINEVTQEMLESVLTTIAQVQNNLLDLNGEYKYVKVLSMTKGRDNPDPKLISNFNKLAKPFNAALEFINIPLYEIKYPTTKEYSSGYVHFNNKKVWQDMLK